MTTLKQLLGINDSISVVPGLNWWDGFQLESCNHATVIIMDKLYSRVSISKGISVLVDNVRSYDGSSTALTVRIFNQATNSVVYNQTDTVAIVTAADAVETIKLSTDRLYVKCGTLFYSVKIDGTGRRTETAYPAVTYEEILYNATNHYTTSDGIAVGISQGTFSATALMQPGFYKNHLGNIQGAAYPILLLKKGHNYINIMTPIRQAWIELAATYDNLLRLTGDFGNKLISKPNFDAHIKALYLAHGGAL